MAWVSLGPAGRMRVGRKRYSVNSRTSRGDWSPVPPVRRVGAYQLGKLVGTPRVREQVPHQSQQRVWFHWVYAGRVRNVLAENASRVVGPDQGPTPPDLSSCSLFQWRREREREPGICNFFFVSTTPCKQSSTEVSWRVVKSMCFFHIYYLYLFVVAS